MEIVKLWITVNVSLSIKMIVIHRCNFPLYWYIFPNETVLMIKSMIIKLSTICILGYCIWIYAVTILIKRKTVELCCPFTSFPVLFYSECAHCSDIQANNHDENMMTECWTVSQRVTHKKSAFVYITIHAKLSHRWKRIHTIADKCENLYHRVCGVGRWR